MRGDHSSSAQDDARLRKLVVALIFSIAGYGGYTHYETQARDRADDVMTRRIEALEHRLLNCGQ